MKQFLKPNYIPAVAAVCGGIGLVLRLELYLSAMDEKGLLIPGHPLEILLLGLTAAVMVFLVVALWPLFGSLRYSDNFPASRTAAIGAAVGAAGMLLGVLLTKTQPDPLFPIWKTMGLIGAVCLLLTGKARLEGKQPNFLLHGAVSVFWLVHLVYHYRGWSINPQLQDYLFSLFASVGFLMFSYYQTAFDVNSGKRRNMMAVGLGSTYFGLVALSGCETPLLYGGCAVWALTNLCSLVPVRRRPNPVTEGE